MHRIAVCRGAAVHLLAARPSNAADQQAPYQPSGNGIKGQASSLSLAAFGGASTIRKWAKKSSCGARSIVILTASSSGRTQLRSYRAPEFGARGDFARAQRKLSTKSRTGASHD